MANCIFSREGSLGISRRRPWIFQTAFLFLLASVPKRGERREWGLDGVKCPPKNQASVSVLHALFRAPVPFWVFSGRGKKATIYWQLGGQWGVGWGFHSRSFFPFAATSATDATKLSRSLPLFAALSSKTERGRELRKGAKSVV